MTALCFSWEGADSRELNMAWFVRGMTFQRAEISRLRIGGIAYHELGELRDWWVFLFRGFT